MGYFLAFWQISHEPTYETAVPAFRELVKDIERRSGLQAPAWVRQVNGTGDSDDLLTRLAKMDGRRREETVYVTP